MKRLLAALCAGWLGGAVAAQPAAPGAPPQDIREIRGPKELEAAWRIPALVAGAVVLIGAAYAARRWYRRDRRPPPLEPHQAALRALDALRTQEPALGAKAFAAAAADIIRRYIEARFGVTAMRRTTEEFLAEMRQSGKAELAAHRDLLDEFLRRCDYAKFAGAAADAAGVEGMYGGARTFVSETAPREPHDSIPAA